MGDEFIIQEIGVRCFSTRIAKCNFFQSESHMDLVFENNDRIIARANRLLVAAFSTNIEQELLSATTGVVTLVFDPVATGESDTFSLVTIFFHSITFCGRTQPSGSCTPR